MVEEQLELRIAINTLKESNEKTKHEILENCMILQNILMILTTGSSIVKTEQMQLQQGERPKQRLKKKTLSTCGGM